MRAHRVGAALAGAALAAACVYTFDNPVASLPAGSLTGHLVLQGAAAGQSLDGGTIKIAWSGLSVPLQPSGFFGFLDLPDGTYTLVYQVPPAGAGDPPFIGILRDVVIPAVSGAADAVDLGTIQVAPAGTVVGTVVGGQDPMVVAFFNATDGGGEVFEGFHTTTADGGRFQLTIPAGSHILVASSATLSAETPFTLGSLQTLELPPLTLQAPTDGGAGMAGNLTFGVGASASPEVVSSLTQGMGASDFPPLGGSVGVQQQVPQVGLPFAQPVRPGRPYDFVATLAPAQAATDGVYDPLSIKQLPVLAGHPTNLGPVPWFPRPVFAANDGGESSPVWSGVEGSPSSGCPAGGVCTGQGVGGPGSCASCNAALQDGGAACLDAGCPVQKLLVLPLGSSGSHHHLLVWTDASGTVWSSDDLDGGGFGSAAALGYSSRPATLAGASDGEGGAVVAWALPEDGGVEIAYDYQSPGWSFQTPEGAGEAVAVATGGAVVFTTASGGLQLLPDPTSTLPEISSTQGLFAGVAALAVVPCQTDLPDGLCVTWTDATGGLHVALLDPAAVPDGGFLIADAGSLLAGNAQNPSIASFVDPVLQMPYLIVSWESQGLQWGYLTSALDPGQWALQPVGATSTGPALLLPWQGVPLAVYETDAGAMASSTLPPGVVPSPVFPGQAASQAPAGYAEPDGTLDLALINPDGGPALFQLAP